MFTNEIRAQSRLETSDFNQFEARWDFEEVLAELRRNPVLEIIGSDEKVFAIECFAIA